MKATLDKEMEKAKAAESVEEEASRAAVAKAASITQTNLSFLNANASEWLGRTEKTLEIRSDKKSKHSADGSVNTVDFLAVQATSPQRKGSMSKRVQINESPDSSDTAKNNVISQGEELIQPTRLFDDDADLSHEQKDLLAYFAPGGEASQQIQHSLMLANLDSSELESK